ncbi:hypothetical protein BJY00DRAFT_297613 [Aspergillus carlsbadensis]|nr:hypothetical protein BJY00DRAFT_297613 [Aspergillus carlsbadensis]
MMTTTAFLATALLVTSVYPLLVPSRSHTRDQPLLVPDVAPRREKQPYSICPNSDWAMLA